MLYILLFLCLIQLAAIIWLALQVQKLRNPQDDNTLRTLRQEIAADTQNQMQMLGNLLSENQRQSGDYQAERLEQMERNMDARLRQFESRVGNLERSNAQGMEQIRSAVAANLHRMQAQQQDSLAEIQTTVNEKLAQSLNQQIGQSFQLVSSRLEQVYQGLGEMQTLAVGVGDLKKVLSNVKTRGILGEVQLGAILQEILSPEQYATEIPTLPNSRNHVEFAVRMPADGEQPVWLPIDSKFPGDTYAALQDAREQGDPQQVEAARQKLLTVVRGCAKDIRDKYVQPPYTTNFGILFLPFEGLYAEVVNAGLLEVLQRDYQVNVAGPSTMAALLNSLQMGFKTLAIQKRSGEVWQLLGAVKTEFDKFGQGLAKMQQRLRQTDEELDQLIGVRSRAISRKLRSVQSLDEASASALLEIDDMNELPKALSETSETSGKVGEY